MSVSIKSKVSDLVIVDNTFDGEDGSPVNYKRLVLVVEFDGVAEEYEMQFTRQVGKAGYRLVQLADDVL